MYAMVLQAAHKLLAKVNDIANSFLGNPSVTSVIKCKLDSTPVQTLIIDYTNYSKRKKTNSVLKAVHAILLSLPLVTKLGETF